MARAKPASEWTRRKFASYRITLQHQDHLTFFDVEALPQPQVDPELLSVTDAAHTTNDRNAELLHLLDMAMTPRPGDSAVADFSASLLRVLGYVKRNCVVRTGRDLALLICGEYKHTQMDASIIDRNTNDIVLLVQENKAFQQGDCTDSEAQLIAQAIAAFGINNRQKVKAGLDPMEKQVIPGIVMTGTTPTFYKIPVTEELLRNVACGECPYSTTRITSCSAPLPRPTCRDKEGMKPLDNRRQILSCYEAFKKVTGI